MPTLNLAALVAHAKTYGFLYPSSEIYDGLQAVYDYGPYGVLLKNRLKEFWWKSMVQLNSTIVGLDAAILMHPTAWQASGHVAGFHDWLVDNKDSKKRYRLDILLEEAAAQLEESGEHQQAKDLLQKLHAYLAQADSEALYGLLKASQVRCPIAKTANWTLPRKFNLMFSTKVGALQEEAQQLYLRPETAQGIFVNFLQVQKSARMKVPFGIAQIGKAFRNELITRHFIFRMREFEQMEMQFFVPPDTEGEWFDHWQRKRKKWYETLGIQATNLQLVPHQTLAHYARKAVDITYEFPFGQKEVEGIHARGDFDLHQHQTYAKKKLQYFDPSLNESYIPHVIETSVGLDRLVLMLLCEKLVLPPEGEADKKRAFLQLPPPLAPIQAAILPLMKKDGLDNLAQSLFQAYSYRLQLHYDEVGSIGKRYARQDVIGTPFCLTIDYQTLVDKTITLRLRDTTEQKRLPIDEAMAYVMQEVALDSLLRQLVS